MQTIVLNDWHFTRLTAIDAVDGGVLDDAEIESAKRDLDEREFRQSYMAEPSDDAGNPFGYRYIDQCITDGLSSKPPVSFGIDLARSVDFTCIVGLDEDQNVCYYSRFQQGWDQTESIIQMECFEYDVPIVIDQTGVGAPIVERLEKIANGNVHGFLFTSTSKQALIQSLIMAIQKQEIRFPDNDIAFELRNFGYETTRLGNRYEAVGSAHDDTVIALALALHCWDEYGNGGYYKCTCLGYESKSHCRSFGIW